MVEPAPLWRSDIFGILPHPAAPRLLLVPEGAGWTLPHAHLDRYIWLDKLGVVSTRLGAVLGTALLAYRYASYRRDKERHREEGIYVLAWDGPADPPPGNGRWIDRHELPGLALHHPAHRAVLEAYLLELASGAVPERRPPWARPGWFAGAATWIGERLTERGAIIVGPIEQVRNWSLSCVLRVPTDSGIVYFKASADPPLFANEPRVMTHLAEYYPTLIPTPLASDAARRWLLLADFGPQLGWGAGVAEYEAALRAFGRLQLATATQTAGLLAAGCLDRRLARLVLHLPALLVDAAFLAHLDPADVARLRQLAPRVASLCAELGRYRLPPTLVHGDLHGGNIAVRDGGPRFFDWTDACVSHPFFDLPILLPGEDAATEARLRDTYLALWTAYESPERLLAAWALARPLGALHQLFSHQAIVASLEARCRVEVEGDMAFWVRQFVRWMPDDAATTG